MERTQLPVLIAGAGIAGLAASRALRLKGITSLVFERQPEESDGLAINLPGNAIAALARLGLGDELLRYGRPVHRREYRTEQGRLLFAVDEDAFWGSELRPRCLRRADLIAMLGANQPAGSIRRGAALTGVEEMEDSVRVKLSCGTAITGKLLVGAVGVRSATRKAMLGSDRLEAARLAAASWRFMAANPGVDCWTVWAGKKATILLIPVDAHQVYGWAAATREPSAPLEPQLLTRLVQDFPAPVRKAVEDARRLHHSPLEEVQIDRWGSKRIVLIGDAAHATAPVWAQGAALAIEDALVLADLMAEEPYEAHLAHRLEARRRARVSHVQAMTNRMSKAARLPTALRDLLLPFLGPRSYRATYAMLKEAVV